MVKNNDPPIDPAYDKMNSLSNASSDDTTHAIHRTKNYLDFSGDCKKESDHTTYQKLHVCIQTTFA